MALSTTNVSTTIVSQAIGVSTHNVGALCSMAATGGINGYAFKVAELGYPITDGGLIDGALPKFNIWSANSPAELSFSGNTMIWRLKRSPSDSSRYAYRLGAFGGYNHNAVAPTFTGDESFVTYYQNSLPTNRSVAFSVNLGSYDFRNITGCFMGRVVIRRASDNYLVATKGIELTTPISSTIDVPLSSMTGSYNTYIATLEFQNAVNGNWCVLQDYSFQFGITIANNVNNITLQLPVTEDAYNIINRTYESDRYTIEIQAKHFLPLNMALYGIYIEITDANGNYITSQTYSKDSIDSPATINGMSENQTQLFTAHCGSGSGRVYATGTQKTNITMIYINPM